MQEIKNFESVQGGFFIDDGEEGW